MELSVRVAGQVEALKRATDCLKMNVNKTGIATNTNVEQAFNMCRSNVNEYLNK